jgi:hypothetical protein
VLKPIAANAEPQGDAKAASILPRTIKDQIADPATDVPAPVSDPQDAETPTATFTLEVKETATPELPTAQPSETPVPADTDTPAPDPTGTQTPIVEAPTDTPPVTGDLPTETPAVDVATATPEAPTPTGSPTIPTKLLPMATINLTDAENTALVQ